MSLTGSSTPAPFPRSATGWAFVGILLAFYVFCLLDRQILSLLATSVQQDLHLSDVQLGLLQGFAFGLLFALAGLPLGWAVDRYPRRLIIFLGVIVWSVSCAGGGFAQGFVLLFLCRIGVGVGEAALLPGAYSIFRDLFPPSRLAGAVGVFSLGGTLGLGASYAFSGNLLAFLNEHGAWFGGNFRPWQVALIVAGLPGACLCWLVFTLPEPKRRAATALDRSSSATEFLKAILRHRASLLTLHILGFAFAVMTTYEVYAWTPVFLTRHYGWQPAKIGNTLAICLGLMPGVGSMAVGFVADRFFAAGMRDVYFRLMLAVLPLEIVAALLAYMGDQGTVFIICLGFIGCGFGMIPTLAATSLQLIVPQTFSARATSLYVMSVGLLAAGCGPLLVGFITDHVLKDRFRVGSSISLSVTISNLISCCLLAIAIKSFRRIIDKELAADSSNVTPGGLQVAPSILVPTERRATLWQQR